MPRTKKEKVEDSSSEDEEKEEETSSEEESDDEDEDAIDYFLSKTSHAVVSVPGYNYLVSLIIKVGSNELILKLFSLLNKIGFVTFKKTDSTQEKLDKVTQALEEEKNK